MHEGTLEKGSTMTETTRRTTRLGIPLAALVVALTLTFSGVAQADLVNVGDEGPVDFGEEGPVEFGENGAVHNGQPQDFQNVHHNVC